MAILSSERNTVQSDSVGESSEMQEPIGMKFGFRDC